MCKKILPGFFLIALIALTVSVYSVGVAGDFIFDDFPNLKVLSELGGVKDWATFKSFVLGGFSGPTGRPLSLISFLINDNAWPSVAESFKYTNVCLHLICGLLLVWVTYLLLLSVNFDEERAIWISLISSGLWMLHPYWVSTTLYVVQRMTILSCLFSLLGMLGYLKGRSWLVNYQQSKKYHAYLLMTISVVLGTVLATLSKENGALLPLLLLVIEIFIFRLNDREDVKREWVIIFLAAPALVVLCYLIGNIDSSSNVWPYRNFNQIERIYSESRIVWGYIGQLLIPRIEGVGLYQDGFNVSRSLLHPVSTFFAIFGWFLVICGLPYLYRKFPFLFFSILFFLCGHLVESTVIGLELYFEHRNYVPALFIFFPIVIGVDWVGKRYGVKLSSAIFMVLILWFSGFTWQRSQLWADSENLQMYWALKDPASSRGRNFLINRLISEGRYEDALAMADKAMQDLPESALMTISWLRLQVGVGKASDQQFSAVAEKLATQKFDAQAVAVLRSLVDDIVAPSGPQEYSIPMLNLMGILSEKASYKDTPLFLRISMYSNARLYLQVNNVDKYNYFYRKAIDEYGIAGSSMQMFSEVANAGDLKSAGSLLEYIEIQIENNKLNTFPFGKNHYLREVDNMRRELNKEDVVK